MDFSVSPRWKRSGALLGVIGAFFVFATIPGWFALGHYRRWKSGAVDRISPVLIAWGYIFGAFAVVVLVGLGLAAVLPR